MQTFFSRLAGRGCTPASHNLSLPSAYHISRVPNNNGPNARRNSWRASPHAAMEHPGHAQVPTLPMGLVRRQATRADWTAEIEGENREERKFDKEERYEFPRFDLQNILEGRLYLFRTQHGFFLHCRDHRNFMILKIHRKIECFCKFSDIKNGPFWSPLAPKGAPC